ncbi:MAG: PP2C family protein-serine/threonine phosphatase [Saprospiraceae bacterium]|nr:PP2C family protein-serine/threonine phosphatase [Saprospiraceae bacterium]
MEEHTLSEYVYPQIEKLENELENKQVQLNFLMRITQAINANMSSTQLFEMYSHFLQSELGVKRLAMYFKEQGKWICRKAIDFAPEQHPNLSGLLTARYTDFSRVGELSPPELKLFEMIIPVLHKDDPIAYILIGRFQQTEDEYDRIKFIITITNVVAVAIENKRLFNQQLQQETYRKEMELAQQVQQMLIPTILPNEENVEISAIYRPHSNIGGDYFDYFKLDSGGFIICLADVSGKGIPAALLMANFQATLRSAMLFHHRLDDLVRYLNHTLVSITKSERIVTFFILQHDPERQLIRYVNAGHYPPLMVRGRESMPLTKGCTILGAVENLDDIEVGEIPLDRKETLFVLYTDGLTDLRNNDGNYFDDQMIREFSVKHRKQNARVFNEHLLKAMEEFKGKQEFPDDIAVLTCKIKPKDS